LEIVGLGGGTCAAYFRYADIPAVVWGHMDHVAHQANEYCILDYIYTDIGIYCAFLGDWR
jgi:succinyl-diaminopimelate desuccinylase